MLNPWVLLSGACTAIGALAYYRVLSSKGIAYMTLTWPATMALSMAVAYFVFGERLSRRRLAGMFIAI